MLSFLFVLAIACSKPVDSSGPATPAADGSAVNKSLLLQLVNDVRKNGCQCGDTWYPPAPAVTWNDLLEKAAQNHSRDMYQNNYFSHTSKDGNKAGYRLRQVGYNWMSYGENIAMGFKNEKDVVAGWISSPGHCKNIMNKTYKEMGVAKTGEYWTQNFGSR
ncbi:MAG TPA: CAP domain-containing protein [Flavisolibacter sp.]|nr:CAP domain-containing protein [Flavisolibacter sp.]